jgi:hypothetical protein
MDGNFIVNGEKQKTADEILPEVLIAIAMSEFNISAGPNRTPGFVKLLRVYVVKGSFVRT